MIRNFFNYPLSFIFLVLLQVLLLNNIQFSGFINPYLYIIFILWLPIEIPNWLLLVICFALGISIDMFSDTLGMHTSATLFLGFCRPSILALLAPRDGYEKNALPRLHEFGWTWFLTYAGILTLAHHLFLFFVEVARFSDFWSTIGRSLASSFFSLILIIIAQLFSLKVKNK